MRSHSCRTFLAGRARRGRGRAGIGEFNRTLRGENARRGRETGQIERWLRTFPAKDARRGHDRRPIERSPRTFPARAALLALLVALLTPGTAWASTAGGALPFVDGLRTIMEDVTGPVATILIFIGIAIALVAWGTSDRHDKIVTAGKGLVALAIIATLGATLGILGINAATM